MSTSSKQALIPPGGWQNPGRVRIPPLDTKQASLKQRLLLGTIERVGKLNAANLWRMLMHNGRMLRGILMFAPNLMPFGELERRDTELVILRVGWNCRARYEWGQHVDIGLRAGLTAEEIARVTQGPDAIGWSAKQVSLLKACDEFHKDRMVSEPTWQALSSYFNSHLLLELLMLIGFYEGLAGVLNTTGLPLDAPLEKVLADLHNHAAKLE